MASLELRSNGIWHLRYRDKRGKSRSISTKIHTSPKNDILAQKKLAAFELDLSRGKSPTVTPRIGVLLDDVLNDYTVNNKKSASDAKLRIEKHLRPWFGEMRTDRFGADDWREYIAHRQVAEAANATINRERALLVRAFSLAKQAGKIDAVPYVPRLKESAPRSGFLTRTELESLCRHLPGYLATAARFAFLTGWRLGEIRQLQWRHIDFERGEIRLDLGSTKNNEGRVFPMTAELRQLLEVIAPAFLRPASHRPVPPQAGMRAAEVPTLTPYVFHLPNGMPLGYIYHSWQKAAKAIGKPGLLFHDLRRSAAIYMDQQGIKRRVIQELMGHKTGLMFDRYRRVTTADLDDARAILDRSHKTPPKSNTS